jgi:mannose/fructose/N-acetylgalactosamine-specific phosphotransferase system component IIC
MLVVLIRTTHTHSVHNVQRKIETGDIKIMQVIMSTNVMIQKRLSKELNYYIII